MIKTYALYWKDGVEKLVDASSIEGAICKCGKGRPYHFDEITTEDKYTLLLSKLDNMLTTCLDILKSIKEDIEKDEKT